MATNEATAKRDSSKEACDPLRLIMSVPSPWTGQQVERVRGSDPSGRVRCACGREFRPDFAGQRFCDHACYSASIRVPIEHRFWTKVNKFGPAPAHLPKLGPCWLWTAGTIRGYGQIAGVVNGKRRPLYAHRLAWELTHGPILNDLECLHRCDIPLCVRPDHLFLGTQQDNLADARQKGRLDESRPRTVILTPADRLDIYNTPDYRGVGRDLSRRYGVSKACISVIRKGRFKRPRKPLSLSGQRNQTVEAR